MSRPLPPKKDVAMALLQGPSLFVHLDPRKEGVTVPSQFTRQSQLVLQLGMNLAVQIPDLDVDDEGISCTLSFNRQPFWCHLPWPAVYALVGEDGRGMIWPESVPAELATEPKRPTLRAVDSKKPKKKKAAPKATPAKESPRPALRAVPSAAAKPPAAPDEASAERPKLPPYLRVIK